MPYKQAALPEAQLLADSDFDRVPQQISALWGGSINILTCCRDPETLCVISHTHDLPVTLFFNQ